MASPFKRINPHLIPEACEELIFPEPYAREEQIAYVRRLLLGGYTINTRQARFIGIHNLHSIAAELRRKRLPFETDHKLAMDPRTGELPPQKVDHLYMTEEQRALEENAPTEAEA
ncbi:hypothetical protein [Aeromonas media]|uniref:hypothetical protein n=1 Tax=Aeromonas media TaxID=651 RepID=UPI003D1EAABA